MEEAMITGEQMMGQAGPAAGGRGARRAKAAVARLAPEVKAAPDTVTAAFAEFMTAFEAFKEANDERLGEIEEKLTSDVVTRDKVERINKAIDEQSRLLDELVLKKRRPALERPGREEAGLAEHKAAFEAYVRRGDDQALRDLDQKALSAGVSGDGGYLVPPQVDEEIGRRLRVISPIRSLATVRQVSGSVLKKPFAATGFASGWVAETAARTQTGTPELSELAFPTMELYAMPAATQGLLDDAAVDIEAWIAAEVDIAFAEQEGEAFVSGDGVLKPKGFLAYDKVDDGAWEWGKIGTIATGSVLAALAPSPVWAVELKTLTKAAESGDTDAAATLAALKKTNANLRGALDDAKQQLAVVPRLEDEIASLKAQVSQTENTADAEARKQIAALEKDKLQLQRQLDDALRSLGDAGTRDKQIADLRRQLQGQPADRHAPGRDYPAQRRQVTGR